MTFGSPLPRIAVALALALVVDACGKKADSRSDGDIPEVSAKVPDVAGGGAGDAEVRELSRYQLTMAKIRQLAAAQENMERFAQQHPELARGADTASSDLSDLSLDDIEAQVERFPAGRKAVEDAGLSAREYALITVALFQASLGQILVQQGANPDSVAREGGIHPSNLRFVKEHEAELAKLKHLLQ